MVPTLLGVVLLTFVLFHVVGGSPAAATLGQHASPRALEEFDEQRGYNRPLLLGHWARTRAFEAWPGPGAARVPAGWPADALRGTAGDVLRLRLERPGTYLLPRAFALPRGARARLRIGYRTEGAGARAVLGFARPGPDGGAPALDPAAGFQALEAAGAGASNPWKRGAWVFAADTPGELLPALRLEQGAVEIRALRFDRRTRHLFDSQLAFFFGRLLHGDLGVSARENRPVADILRGGIGPSLALTVPILTLGVLLALGISLACAYARDTWMDRAVVVGSVALMSVNYLVWIIAGQYLLAFRLGWFPVWGFESWAYLALPVLVGVASGLGADLRFYRTVMLDEMYREYVRTALAKGAGRARVLVRHVLPNAMIPVVTHVALSLPFLYTGSLLLESFFGIPGLGYVGVNAVNASDVDVVRAIVLVGSVLYLFANLATDVAYACFDPRVKLS